ncbi:MAG: hypothetical protein ISR83_06690 [Candidatus Marinimicrobia bacterium]|nr:hypothetical protein [Candidatus Neomarinimicrobiota bacterium]
MFKRIIFFGFILSICFADKPSPFEIDVRPRLVKDEKVVVTIQVTSFVNQPIEFLEGFLEEKTATGNLLQEKRITLVYGYEPPLFVGFSTTNSEIFPMGPWQPNKYEFKISKVRFRGDKRIFTWHPKSGFIRVD